MATKVHQQLDDIGIPNVRERVIQPLGFSGFADIAQKGFNFFKTNKKNKEAFRQEGVLSSAAIDQNQLQIDLQRDRKFRTDTNAMGVDAQIRRDDGDISEEDKVVFDEFSSRLLTLREMQKSGNLNSNIFNIKLREISGAAFANAPGMTLEIQRLLGTNLDDASDITEQQEAENKMFNQLSQQRGGAHNVTPDAYATALGQAAEVQAFEQKIALGTIQGSEISADMDNQIGIFTTNWAHSVQNLVNLKGALSVEDVFSFNEQLTELRATSQARLSQSFTASHRAGRVISDDVKNTLRAQSDRNFDRMKEMLEGKDVGARFKAWNDAQDAGYATGQGAQVRAIFEIMEKGGLPTLQEMINMIRKPAIAEAMIASGALSREAVNAFPSIVKGITDSYVVFSNGSNLAGNSRLTKMQSLTANLSLGGGTATEPTVRAFTNEALKKIHSQENMDDVVSYLTSGVVSANLVQEANTQAKAELTQMFNILVEQYVVGAVTSFNEDKHKDIIFGGDPSRPNRFNSKFDLDKISGSLGDIDIIARATDQAISGRGRAIKRLNDLIKLSEDPNYLGLMPTREEIVNSVQLMIRASNTEPQ